MQPTKWSRLNSCSQNKLPGRTVLPHSGSLCSTYAVVNCSTVNRTTVSHQHDEARRSFTSRAKRFYWDWYKVLSGSCAVYQSRPTSAFYWQLLVLLLPLTFGRCCDVPRETWAVRPWHQSSAVGELISHKDIYIIGGGSREMEKYIPVGKVIYHSQIHHRNPIQKVCFLFPQQCPETHFLQKTMQTIFLGLNPPTPASQVGRQVQGYTPHELIIVLMRGFFTIIWKPSRAASLTYRS